MNSMTFLEHTLEQNASKTQYLFSEKDILPIFPDFTIENLRVLLSRAAKKGVLERVCKGIYLYPKVNYDTSLVLFNVAAKLRAQFFNYVSFETALSQAGIISQMPLAWISIMTRGRRGIINCGRFGSIEFIHTEKQKEKILPELYLDKNTKMWWASPRLAIQDMKDAKRSLDLINKTELEQVKI